MDFSFGELRSLVSTHAGIRRKQRLQPLGGDGDKIFPPTYPADEDGKSDVRDLPPRHIFEVRRLGGREVPCVLLDSVQSQANRLEAALQNAADTQIIQLPYLQVQFTDADLRAEVGNDGRITSLETSHRIYDATFRDSLLEGLRFIDSPVGRRLKEAKITAATAVLELSPTALVFGAWHSQSGVGCMAAKFFRCLSSEIVGVDTPVEHVIDPRTGDQIGMRTAGRQTSSRLDGLGIVKGVDIYKAGANWSNKAEDVGPDARLVRPSEINHGHITPSVQPLGVTMEYGQQTMVLTFAGLRQLRFGTREQNDVARTYLAALALLSCLEQDLYGFALRSRCDLVPEQAAEWECIAPNGARRMLTLDVLEMRALYAEALAALSTAGFQPQLTPTILQPQAKLITLMRQSRERTLHLPPELVATQ